MWTCPTCGRIFKRAKQQHSCKKVPLLKHFENKESAKKLFDYLVENIQEKIGPCKIISIPCCIHLFGTYDFLAALPKKDHLEIRFALDYVPDSPRVNADVPLSSKKSKICLDIHDKRDIDSELINWLLQSYTLTT